MNREQLYDILMSSDVVNSICNNLDTLLELIPELNDMIGFEHNHPHHHLDVWEHTLLALSLSPNEFKIRLILLLHDIGKPHCFQDMEIRHFKGHPKKSSIIAYQILTRLEFDSNEKDEICFLINYHDTLISKKLITSNITIAKLLFKIQFCDAMAHNPTKLEKRKRYLLDINDKINFGLEKEIYKNLIINIQGEVY